MINSYLDILDRAKNSPLVSKEDWDMEHVVMPVRRLIKKYQLSWDNDQVIPLDEDLVSRLFQAGMELAVSSGIFCIATGRVIRFSIQEILEGIKRMPLTLQMGEGKDARELFARKVMDARPPLVWAGNPGAPT